MADAEVAPMHPERRRRTEQLKQLADAGDYQQLYQLLMLREFPFEARMGWQLAFLRPFAVPRMADILVHAGELVVQPRKRAYDTGLIIYEIVHGGIDSPRAKQMVSLINRVHDGHGIADVDMTYVLCAFIVTPLRHIDWVGWRPLADYEKHAAVEFFGRLARLMNITTVPVDYAEAERMYDAYEASHIGPSPSGFLLGHNLVDVLKSIQPAPLRPFAALVFNLLLSDNAIAKSVGLRSVPAPIRGAVRAFARASARVQSFRAPSSKTVFIPGQAVHSVYPHGYQLEELGPHGTAIRKTGHVARPSRPWPPFRRTRPVLYRLTSPTRGVLHMKLMARLPGLAREHGTDSEARRSRTLVRPVFRLVALCRHRVDGWARRRCRTARWLAEV